ncbi:hydroxyproline dehydrogenase-like isoform X1 [Montipora capricornis]|uniref:hydroxyproline dehydrogenase-like isoform X1 n=2 Tax=Montipora capricornis TaxID=246305 RepID=UPI0035F1851A
MASVRQFRRFGFVIKPHLRCFHSASVEFRAMESSSPSVAKSFNTDGVYLEDNARIFASKKTTDILRSLLVLKVCSYDFVGKNAMKLMSFGQRVLGKTLFEFLLRETMYSQFVAGEELSAIQDSIQELRQCGIGTMLCVPNEEDLSSDDSDFSEREAMFDRNAKLILDCIGKTEEGGFSQMKVTAICSPLLLNVWNDHLAPFETSVEAPVGLDVQTLAEGFDRNIEVSVLNKNQNAHLQNVLSRLDTCSKACIGRNVRLVIDAEQTYLQAPINHMVLALQYKYNRNHPWIYNTYQCYRKDTHDRLKANMELMDKLGFHFGAKIVRGAYMTQERNRAADMGYKDPIHDTYKDTCAMYDEVVYTVLKKASFSPAEVMVATHNAESVKLVIQRMKELSIVHDASQVTFGQLYGMCDQVSYMLGQNGYSVYKSVPYGPVGETLAYLGRRATENRDVITRTENERSLLWLELKRRMVSGQ